MSRKTPKSKSSAAAATAPKAKSKPKPLKPKASSSGTKKKRSASNISLETLANRVTALESGNSAFQHDLQVLMVEINLISEWIKNKFGKINNIFMSLTVFRVSFI